MFMRDRAPRVLGVPMLACALAVAIAQPSAAQSGDGALLTPLLQTPDLGKPATDEEVAGWDLSIGPDGENLPPGSGTAARGAEVYAAKCAACHGADGAGQPNDRLAGGHGTLTDPNPVRTIGSYWPYATTVFDYIRRAMPYTQPQSLTSDEVYALTAYLLFVNDVIDEGFVVDADTLPSVEMPNRANFRAAYPDWQN